MIYDVKMLVVELVSVGEQYWSVVIFKCVVVFGCVVECLCLQEVVYLVMFLFLLLVYYLYYGFCFIDLFVGIGGICSGFEVIGGQCVFISEWNKYVVCIYKVNWYCDLQQYCFNEDICDIIFS